MNWGNKIILAFLLFAGLIITLVYKSMHTKYDLVSKNYYQDELRFQEKIDGAANAGKLTKVIVRQDKESLVIILPVEMKGTKVQGEAWFYCTTDADKDQKIILDPDENGEQRIPKNTFQKGSYELKLNWQTPANKYYTEQIVILN